MLKTICSFKFGAPWFDGATLQTYIYDAMWQRPGGKLVWQIQKLVVTQPLICVLMGLAALCFEVGFPVVCFIPATGPLLGLVGIGFHTGIWVLQGLDFVTFWATSLLMFAVEGFQGCSAAVSGSDSTCHSISETLTSGWAETPYSFGLAALYTGGQLFAAITLADITMEEILPWSAFPMFLMPRNVFSKWPRFFVMTGPDLRIPGCMESAVHSPLTPVYPLSEAELQKVPYPILQFGSLEHVPTAFEHYFFPKFRGTNFFVFSNFTRSAKLDERLQSAIKYLQEMPESAAWDSHATAKIVEHVEVCRRQFVLECAKSSEGKKID
eukprot:SAG31_NODE_3084_length_4695_cov_3.336741_4_plen_324_part_00